MSEKDDVMPHQVNNKSQLAKIECFGEVESLPQRKISESNLVEPHKELIAESSNYISYEENEEKIYRIEEAQEAFNSAIENDTAEHHSLEEKQETAIQRPSLCRDSPVETEFQVASAIFEGNENISDGSLSINNDDNPLDDLILTDEDEKKYDDESNIQPMNVEVKSRKLLKRQATISNPKLTQEIDTLSDTADHLLNVLNNVCLKRLGEKPFAMRSCDDELLQKDGAKFHSGDLDCSMSSPCLLSKDAINCEKRLHPEQDSSDLCQEFSKQLATRLEKESDANDEKVEKSEDVVNQRLDLIEKSLRALHEARSEDLEKLLQTRNDIDQEIKSCSHSVAQSILNELTTKLRLKEVVTESLQEVFETLKSESPQNLQEIISLLENRSNYMSEGSEKYEGTTNEKSNLVLIGKMENNSGLLKNCPRSTASSSIKETADEDMKIQAEITDVNLSAKLPHKIAMDDHTESDCNSDRTEVFSISKPINMDKITEADEESQETDIANDLSKESSLQSQRKTSHKQNLYHPSSNNHINKKTISKALEMQNSNPRDLSDKLQFSSTNVSDIKRPGCIPKNRISETCPSSRETEEKTIDESSTILVESNSQITKKKCKNTRKRKAYNDTVSETTTEEKVGSTACTQTFSRIGSSSEKSINCSPHKSTLKISRNPNHNADENPYSEKDETIKNNCLHESDSFSTDKLYSEKETNSTYLSSSLSENRNTIFTDHCGQKTSFSKLSSEISSLPTASIFQYGSGSPFSEIEPQNYDPLTIVSALGCQSLQNNAVVKHIKFEKNHRQSLNNRKKQSELRQSPAIRFVDNFDSFDCKESNLMKSEASKSKSCNLCESLAEENMWLNYKITKYEKALKDIRSYVIKAEALEKRRSTLQEQNKQLKQSLEQIEDEYYLIATYTSNLEKERESLKQTLAARLLLLRRTKEELDDAKAYLWQLYMEKATIDFKTKAHTENLELAIIAQRIYFKKLLIELKNELIVLCSTYVDVGTK